MAPPLDVPLEVLRARSSAKWSTFPADVLPLPIAEMDVHLAPPISAALHAAVDGSDTGYAGDPALLLAAFADFAARRWQWRVDPVGVRTCADVAVGVTEVLRRLVEPGDGVVVMPPVYPPFWQWLDDVGARAVEVPLTEPDRGGRLDLPGIERALVAGARVVLLCSPHNPTGRVHSIEELRALAELAAAAGATVLADEIHAPLTQPGRQFVPYLTVAESAAATGIAFHSASKAWNLAGLKCALIVASNPAHRRLTAALPHEVAWGVGHLGVIAGVAAYRDSEQWLDDLVRALHDNVQLLGNLLDEHLPEVTFTPPEASYLAWLDCRALQLGDDPSPAFLEQGVALSPGPDFGPGGAGRVRLNLACSPEVLREAIVRMSAARPLQQS